MVAGFFDAIRAVAFNENPARRRGVTEDADIRDPDDVAGGVEPHRHVEAVLGQGRRGAGRGRRAVDRLPRRVYAGALCREGLPLRRGQVAGSRSSGHDRRQVSTGDPGGLGVDRRAAHGPQPHPNPSVGRCGRIGQHRRVDPLVEVDRVAGVEADAEERGADVALDEIVQHANFYSPVANTMRSSNAIR